MEKGVRVQLMANQIAGAKGEIVTLPMHVARRLITHKRARPAPRQGESADTPEPAKETKAKTKAKTGR